MICDVILTHQNNRYIAQVREWPGVIAEADSRDDVIHQVKSRLSEYLTEQAEVIQVEIPLPETVSNPWIDKSGWFRDDPTFDDWQADMAAYRRELDEAGEFSE